LCTDTCVWARYNKDGVCDDGGPGANTVMCALGTDCTDCGVRFSTKSPTKKPTKSPTKSPTESPTKSPTKAPTEALFQIALSAKIAFAEELANDIVADVSGAIEEKVANDLSIPEDHVKAVMTKAASRARHLLNVVYDVDIAISIPVAKVAEIAEENNKIAQLIDPAKNGTMANSFASLLGSMSELTQANGGLEVTVSSVEVEVLTYAPPSDGGNNGGSDDDGADLMPAAIGGGIVGALCAGFLIGLGYMAVNNNRARQRRESMSAAKSPSQELPRMHTTPPVQGTKEFIL
jgi:hypothetical protein